jgi:type IV pilus assembly protein PilX
MNMQSVNFQSGNGTALLRRRRRAQRGAAMVIALVMLLVLTLLASASARMTLLEERMTGNTQDHNVAFQAAEAALRSGELVAQAANLPVFGGADGGLYKPADPGDMPIWVDLDWGDEDLVHADGELDEIVAEFGGASAEYIVEQLPRVPTPGESLAADATVDEATFYRVTAHGVGISGNARVTLQTTFKR